LLNRPLVFDEKYASEEFNLANNTTEEIEKLYLQKIKENNKNINYLILSDENSLLSPIIASEKTGFIMITNSSNTTEIIGLINSTVNRLNSKGLYINNIDYYLNGAYLLILGNIPQLVKEDPVEASFGLNDPEDGINFTTDLEYGDLNNDTYLDIAVGRLPNDEHLASLMFARTFLQDNKKALVVSEYLHTAWPIILLYGGGGMLEGRTIAKILEDQNYNVTRVVEHRTDPIGFLESLTPNSVEEFLEETNKIGKEIGKILGKSLGTIVSKILIVLKALHYAEQGLEIYLEYDWSTFGPKLENTLEYLQTLNLSENLTQEDAFRVFYILWPYPWEDLTNETLIEQMPDRDIIYYEGIGNGSFWILPNEIPEERGFLDWKEFFMNRYNGSEKLLPQNIPNLNSRIIWDNSDLAIKGEMFNTFLEKGTASFIGASALNYAPFSAEIDSRFFRESSTIGTALVNAINNFRDDWLTWDPLNILRPGIKSKTLREFVLFGDPSLTKDPVIEKEDYTKTIECNSFCELNISIPVFYTVEQTENETTVKIETNDYLLEEFKPIIPLKEFEYYLPFNAKMINSYVTSSFETYENITMPRLDLLSHSLTNLTSENVSSEWYPEKIYRLSINSTIDDRTRVKLVHTIIRYNESNKQAIVYDRINVSLKYETPIEFLLKAKDTTLGQDETITIKTWSNITSNATIYLKISNQTSSEILSKNFSIKKGENSFNILYKPQSTGTYSVEGFLLAEDIVIGPRKDVFDVSPTIQTSDFIQTQTGGGKLFSTFSLESNESINETQVNISTINESYENKSIPSLCGNKICEANETVENCPEDCFERTEEKPKSLTGYFLLRDDRVIGGIIGTFIIIAVYLISKFNVLKRLRT
jgi:hypothetical protein